MTDYARLAADNDPRTIKAAVNLAAAIVSYGVVLEPDGNGRLMGLCPFHEDTRPSLAVWRVPEGDWIWGCWPCGEMGDLFDFIQRWHGCDFRSALAKAVELRDSALPDVPDPGDVTSRPAEDVSGRFGRARSTDAVAVLLAERGINVPVDWLHREFQVASDEGTVYVPHFRQDGNLATYKRRSAPDWTPIAAAGISLNELYGVWRLHDKWPEVVLCEGESDTWTMAWLLRDRPVNVLGLPRGVSSKLRSEWVELLAGRAVTILLDADRAGREGAERWAHSLVARTHVRVAGLPDGTDATSAGPAVALRALDEAWPYVNPGSLELTDAGGKYARRSREEDKPDTPIADFVLHLRRLVVMADDEAGVIFEVDCPGRAEGQFLTGAELSSGPKMRRWCANRALSWKGTERDCASLLELLKARALFIPRVRGTSVVGLHDDAFVLPGEVIGPVGWGYVPPENDVGLGQSLRLSGGDWDPEILQALARLHLPDVITPALGWIAAAPLRSTLVRFPVLTATGGSGWGKTTLIQTLLEAFGFWVTTPTTLTGATAHSVHSYAMATNAFPVWIDEYRPGARPEARLALEQVIRDAWDGSATIKGGLSENRMLIRKLPARAALIVTGEDTFSETSHIERMVMVPVPKDGRNPAALATARNVPHAGLGRAYLEWLLASMRAGTLPQAPDLYDRPAHARACAWWGWQILDQFAREVTGCALPVGFDATRVKTAYERAIGMPPILEAIIEAMDVLDKAGRPIAWRDGDGALMVRPQPLCKWAEQNTDVRMPGGSRAVGDWLKSQYGATEQRHAFGRALKLPADAVAEL